MKIHRLLLLFVFTVLPATLVAQTLVASKNSNKYHYRHCRFAQSLTPANKLEFRSADEAVAAGFVPCKVCKPPGPKTGAVQQGTPTQKGQSYTQPNTVRRCQAITKKGTRCKRNALPGSNYCSLHKK